MGYIKHHTIVVTSWKEENINKVHREAKVIFKECFDKDAPFERDGSKLVSDILQGQTNFYYSFFIAPDGSKEGWSTSDIGNVARKKLVDYINSKAHRDGSNYVDFVEVYFGEDNGYCEIENHN